MAKGIGGNKHKHKDRNNSPARDRYWGDRRLEKSKARKLVKHNGFDTLHEALVFWRTNRQGRVKFTLNPGA